MLFNNITIDVSSGTGDTVSRGIRQKTMDKIAFLHIPKTGGTSVEHTIQRVWGSAQERHYNVRQMQEVLENEDINEYKIFTVVRNPFDRIISTWRWWVYHHDGHYSIPYLEQYIVPRTTFKEYVMMIKEYFKGNINTENNSSKVIINSERAPLSVSHIEKLDWWLVKDDGSLVECDFLRFENLNNEWRKYKETLPIFKELNIKHRLPHKNGTGLMPITRDRKKLYDDETYEIISEIYKDEIEMFNYG
tara:strand:+ start:139 stop:879 length:741 start_codon:yes stop_codon:yes gene_type:complete